MKPRRMCYSVRNAPQPRKNLREPGPKRSAPRPRRAVVCRAARKVYARKHATATNQAKRFSVRQSVYRTQRLNPRWHDPLRAQARVQPIPRPQRCYTLWSGNRRRAIPIIPPIPRHSGKSFRGCLQGLLPVLHMRTRYSRFRCPTLRTAYSPFPPMLHPTHREYREHIEHTRLRRLKRCSDRGRTTSQTVYPHRRE